MNEATITLCTDPESAVGPYVEYTDEDEIEAIEASLPWGWQASWPDQIHVRSNFYRVPLVQTLEPLTSNMISELRDEAGRFGDLETVEACDQALQGDAKARQACAEIITAARAMDDETDFLRVVDTMPRYAEVGDVTPNHGTIVAIRTAAQLAALDWTSQGRGPIECEPDGRVVRLEPELDADADVGDRQRLTGRRLFRRWIGAYVDAQEAAQ